MAQKNSRWIQQQFKIRGYSLNADALKFLTVYLEDSYALREEAIADVLEAVEKKTLSSTIVKKELIENIVGAITGVSDKEDNPFRLINALNMPKFHYDPVTKSFFKHGEQLLLFAEARAKIDMYRDRYMLLHQRLIRSTVFNKPALDMVGGTLAAGEVTTLHSLTGTSGKGLVLGTISQLEDDRYFLEDLTGTVPIDLSEASMGGPGFVVENTIVMAQGSLTADGIFHVGQMAFVPIENKQETLAVAPGIDFSGLGALSSQEYERLAVREHAAENHMFVVMADIWVDHDETMDKFRTVLSGYEGVDIVPSLFILMGNFMHQPFTPNYYDYDGVREKFGRMGKIIAEHPRLLAESKFLFVNGPTDPAPADVLPRPPLPAFFAAAVKEHVPHAMFASNPCRLRFYGQDIVVFREDLQFRLRRFCLVEPNEEDTAENFHHLAITLLHQSHLFPYPLLRQPIYWDFDHSLRLYPVPDVLILGDRANQNSFVYEGVNCFNPGSFGLFGSFVAYRPAACHTEEAVELSSI